MGESIIFDVALKDKMRQVQEKVDGTPPDRIGSNRKTLRARKRNDKKQGDTKSE